jgi:Flp pilus assembly protein protease CpaA
MTGAIFSHVFVLGLNIQNDGGLLFGLACTVFISCLLVLGLQLDRVRSLALFGLSFLKSETK